jgi:hypothetical protein
MPLRRAAASLAPRAASARVAARDLARVLQPPRARARVFRRGVARFDRANDYNISEVCPHFFNILYARTAIGLSSSCEACRFSSEKRCPFARFPAFSL